MLRGAFATRLRVRNGDVPLFMNSFSLSVVPALASTASSLYPNYEFDLLPTTPFCQYGEPYVEFSIAATKETLNGLYLLQLQKSQDYNVHTLLPLLKLNVQLVQHVIDMSFYQPRLWVAVNGTALPIICNLTDFPPQNDLKIEVNIYDWNGQKDPPGIFMVNGTQAYLTTYS